MTMQWMKPDYASQHFQEWQTKNPGLQADLYHPSFENHRRSDPNYVMGTNPEWDADEKFLRAMQAGYKPTSQEVMAFQSKQPSNLVASAGHVPNYDDMPGTMVSKHAADTGFELTPGIHWEIVDQLPDYAGHEAYGRRVNEPLPNILSKQYTPETPTDPLFDRQSYQGTMVDKSGYGGYTVPAAGYSNISTASSYRQSLQAEQEKRDAATYESSPNKVGNAVPTAGYNSDPTVSLPATSVSDLQQNPMMDDWNWQQKLTQQNNTTSVTPEMINNGFKFMPGNSYLISRQGTSSY